MKICLALICGLLVSGLFSYGQKAVNDSGINLQTISGITEGNSYITFPADIGNMEPLWFEAGLRPSFYLRKSHNSRLMGVLNPNITIRMFRERSYPVRTPSYMPQVTIYYLLRWDGERDIISVFGKAAHHSNGQDGSFFLDNGTINTISGDFATNFYEAGFISLRKISKLNAWRFFSTSFEVHPESMVADELLGMYSRYRWHNKIAFLKMPVKSDETEETRANLSIRGELEWMGGKYNDLPDISSERINASLTLFYHPSFLTDLGLFVMYYHGNDYYNIYFSHRTDILRFGFMTQNLIF